MNHNEITSMAREAGLFVPRAGLPENGALIRFFHAAYDAGAAAEREACALTCESIARDTYGMVNLHEYGECAAAIRARSQQ